MKLQLLTVFSLLQLSAGDPRLVCEETVETRIRDNVVLRCHLEPKQNIEDEMIHCKRADSSQLVYAYRNRKQLPDQEDQYRHRTSLDFEDLKIGVLNLNINSVTQSDNGTYQFYIRKWRISSTVTLIVGDLPLDCEETVETRIGDNVTLTCHMEHEEIIQHEELEVTKVDPDVLVYFYHNGKQLGDFYEPYRHRTFLNTEELKSGVVNLKIFPVRQSDEGTYRIHIFNRRITTLVTLIVENPLLVCQETVETQMGDDVVLPCHLDPKQNIEDDEVECRRSDSEVLVYARRNGEQLPDQLDQYRYRTSVNTEDLKIGVLNLKISSVRKSDEGTYQFHIPKWRISSTVTLIVGVPLGVLIGVPVGVVLALVVALVVVVWILVKRKVIKRRRTMMMKRRNLKRQHDDEDPQRAAGNYHLDPEHPAESEIMMK